MSQRTRYLLGVIGLSLLVLAGLSVFPDARRYWRIRNM